MMFSSKTPRDLTPHAAAVLCSRCEAEFQEGLGYSEEEHRNNHQPEQHNEPNPILGLAREAARDGCLDAFMEGFLADGPPLYENPWAAHARAVLTRLARLSEGAAS